MAAGATGFADCGDGVGGARNASRAEVRSDCARCVCHPAEWPGEDSGRAREDFAKAFGDQGASQEERKRKEAREGRKTPGERRRKESRSRGKARNARAPQSRHESGRRQTQIQEIIVEASAAGPTGPN